MTEKQLLADAANTLINDPQAPELYRTLLEVLALPQKLPVKLSGEASALNPLLTLARRDREAFDGVVSLVERKRADAGATPLRSPLAEAKFNKNRYQAELMAERRVRTIKAVDIENLRRPPSAQLVGQPRMEFMRVQQSKWMAQLNALLAASSEGKTLPKAQRREASAAFWGTVDRHQEESEAAVYRWIQSGRKGTAP